MKKIEFEKNLFKAFTKEKETIYSLRLTIFFDEQTKKIKIAEVNFFYSKEQTKKLLFSDNIFINYQTTEIDLYSLAIKISDLLKQEIQEITNNTEKTFELIEKIKLNIYDELKKMFIEKGGG